MKSGQVVVLSIVLSVALATVAMAQQPAKPSWLKSMGQTAMQAASQALSPQAQSVVDEAKTLAPAQQENFIVTKAKTFMGQKNYDVALQLANYVITTLNSKSLDASKIVTDAKSALAKIAQEKMAQMQAQSAQANQAQAQTNQAQTDANKVAADAKNLLGSFGGK